jgi:hypothetical protein
MSRTRVWVLGVLAWTFVVVIGSSLVWVVISRAGAGVAPQADSSGEAVADVLTPTPSHGPGPAQSSTTRPTLRPEPSEAPSSAAPSEPPVSSAPGVPSSDPRTAPPPGSGPSAPSSSPAPVRRSWSGTGGTVVAECSGSRISLVAAQPDAGFAVEVGGRGPGEVEVSFHGRGDEERETQVKGVCVGGTPRFSAEYEHDG